MNNSNAAGRAANDRTYKMALLAVLVALTLVMSFTPVGYLKIGFLSITLLSIPVAISASKLGYLGGGVVGLLFGITSFAQCFGMDAFGTALFSLKPFATFVICVVSRLLCGLGAAAIYKLCNIKAKKPRVISYAAAGISAPLLNTLFFLSFLALFFGNTPVTVGEVELDVVKAVVLPALSINSVLEIVICSVLSFAILMALAQVEKRMKR